MNHSLRRKHLETIFLTKKPRTLTLSSYSALSFQITETQYKQFHPDIFHSPWVSVFVKGRIQVHIWAVVIIQRAFRNYIKRKLARLQAKKKASNTKERWRKKAEGDQYQPPPPPPQPPSPPRQAAARGPRGQRGQRGQRKKPPEPVQTKEEEEEEYLRRRRTDFMEDVSEETDYVKTFYENQRNPKGAVGAVYRSET